MISVIVPVYNCGEYLRRCVESLQRQTYEALEIILVDDGSTDGTAELCDSLAAADRRITVLHRPNGGSRPQGTPEFTRPWANMSLLPMRTTMLIPTI